MYPRIPDPPHRYDDEPRMTYAHRVWRELVEGLPVFQLDEEQAEAALHASQLYVTAPEVAPAALKTYHAIRLQLHARIDTFRIAARAQMAPQTAQAAPQATIGTDDGGQAVRRPEPPTRPTPPSTAQQWQPLPSGKGWTTDTPQQAQRPPQLVTDRF